MCLCLDSQINSSSKMELDNPPTFQLKIQGKSDRTPALSTADCLCPRGCEDVSARPLVPESCCSVSCLPLYQVEPCACARTIARLKDRFLAAVYAGWVLMSLIPLGFAALRDDPDGACC